MAVHVDTGTEVRLEGKGGGGLRRGHSGGGRVSWVNGVGGLAGGEVVGTGLVEGEEVVHVAEDALTVGGEDDGVGVELGV